MFELPLQPHLVLKRYRRPAAREFLDDIVAWPERISDAELAQRVRAGDGMAGGHGDRPATPPTGLAPCRSVRACCYPGPPGASPSAIGTARPVWPRSAT